MNPNDPTHSETPSLFADSPAVSRHPFTALDIRVCGRDLQTTPVFDTYWRFATLRQDVYYRRLAGRSAPWTEDAILAQHRFTNAFRAADRVSQFLISDVIYSSSESSWEDQVFRTLLFKFFNKIETWQELERECGPLTPATYDFAGYATVLDRRRDRGDRLYSAAYMIPPPLLGEASKHRNHLRLLELMFEKDVAGNLSSAESMSRAYETLIAFPSIGRFLGFQFVIDLNYGTGLNFTEMDFVVAGPGARDGVRKCFGKASDGIEEPIIRWMAEAQEDQFHRLGLEFNTLFGRRLQLIDAQNLFCEVDKYARVAHPEIQGVSGRSRIKQSFSEHGLPAAPSFPPKWNLDTTYLVDAGADSGHLFG